MRWASLGCVIIALCSGAPELVSAQETAPPSALTPPHAIELEGALAYTHATSFGGTTTFVGLSGGLATNARLRALTVPQDDDAAVLLDVDLTWRFWVAGAVRDDGASICCRALNPYLGASVGWQDTSLRGRIGAGLTLPLTNAFDFGGGAERSVWFAGDVAFAYRDGWIAMGETMAIVLRTDWEWRHEWLRVGAEGALALMIPVRRSDAVMPIDPFTRYQVYASAAAVIDPWIELGLRVGLAGWTGIDPRFPTRVGRDEYGGLPGAPNVDEAQVSVMPFVRGRLAPGFVEARTIVFLDHPSGVLSHASHLTFSVAVGVELD